MLSWLQSAFSLMFAEKGLNFYSLFVPDLLHEFELGVWKSTLTHLIRILHAAGGDKVQEFNRRYVQFTGHTYIPKLLAHRYRAMPTFGRDTIRRFVSNMADLKKMAGRDFEDSLQVRAQCDKQE